MPKEKKSAKGGKKGISKKREAKKTVAKKPSKKELKEVKKEEKVKAKARPPELDLSAEARRAKEETRRAKEEEKPRVEMEKEIAKEKEKGEVKAEVKEEKLEEAEKEEVKAEKQKEPAHFYCGTGRRKTSIAKVRLYQGTGTFMINGRTLDGYIGGRKLLEIIAKKPLEITDNLSKFDVNVNVSGGGVASQTEAIRHGIARALLQVNPDLKSPLKKEGLLTRDPRMKERKKYGRKRARKRFQYSKR